MLASSPVVRGELESVRAGGERAAARSSVGAFLATLRAAGQTAPMRRYFGFFLLSGFAGLVYETVWLRLAMAEYGTLRTS